MTDKGQLVNILKELRSYIAKEYNLNVDDRSLKGEGPSADTTLPADWQAKLEPISGGPGGEREGDKGAEKKATAAGSQGKDAYLHKEGGEEMLEGTAGVSPKASPPQQTQFMAEDEEEMVAAPEEEMPVEEVMEEEGDGDIDDVEKAGMYAMGGDDEVVSLLRDIKGFLENASMAKQSLAAVETVREEMSNLTKSIPGLISSEVQNGTQASLKQFGMRPASGDVPKRTPVNKPVEQRRLAKAAAPVAREPEAVLDTPAAIGVEGDSLVKASTHVNDQEQFVNGVEQLIEMTDVDDLRGTFRKVNRMREESGENLSHNLYYFKSN